MVTKYVITVIEIEKLISVCEPKLWMFFFYTLFLYVEYGF